jgi:hypothetical protein
MITRLALLVLAAFALLLTDAPEAAACSGGRGRETIPVRELIRDADTIVIGETVEVDDASANSIFRVESYLKGNGAEFILLALKSTIQIETAREQRNLSGGCHYISNPPGVGMTSIILLNRREGGEYNAAIAMTGFYSFENEIETIEVPYYWPPLRDNIYTRSFTRPQLEDYIRLLVGIEPSSPNYSLPYPLKAPLLITTASGTNYQFRIDSTPPVIIPDDQLINDTRTVGCAPAPCTAFSPNGLDSVHIMPNPPDFAVATTRWTYIQLQGKAVLFSPTNDTLALWTDNRIELRALWYPRLGMGVFPGDTAPVINQVEINETRGNYATSAFKQPRAVWTHDGRILAYTDARGLWLWDVFVPDRTPRLLIAASDTEELPYANSFSTLGRYLSIEQGEERYILDVISGQHPPYGVISPDERLLLVNEPEPADARLTLYSLVLPGEIRVTDYIVSNQVQQLEWLNNYSFLVSECHPAGDYGIPISPEAVRMHYFEAWCSVSVASGYYFYPVPIADGYRFDYQLETQQLATIIDDTTIAIVTNVNADSPADAIRYRYDLSPYLDSPIVDIQWLPPLFYYED